jgi:hypothetical protein
MLKQCDREGETVSADEHSPAAGEEAPMVRAYRVTLAWEDSRLQPLVDEFVATFREAILHPDDPHACSYDEAAEFHMRVLGGLFAEQQAALTEEVIGVLEPDMRAELRTLGVEAQFIGQLAGMVRDAGDRLIERLRACAAECREDSAFVDKLAAPMPERRDYRPIDWQEDPPSAEAIAAAFERPWIAELPALRPEIAAVLDVCHEWMNGHAVAAQFIVDLDPALAFYATRNRLPEIDFFVHLFRHPTVRARLLGLETLTWYEGAPDDSYAAHVGPTLGFELKSSWVTIGTLASRLAAGSVLGPRKAPSDSRVLELVGGVAEAAFESRYSDALAYFSWKPWASWFFASESDSTYFWFDKATGLVTVLMITDSY